MGSGNLSVNKNDYNNGIHPNYLASKYTIPHLDTVAGEA